MRGITDLGTMGGGKHVPPGNPFMITSNQSYGMSLEMQLKQPEDNRKTRGKQQLLSEKDNLSLLYSRESDSFGAGLDFSDSTLAKMLQEKSSILGAKKECHFAQQQLKKMNRSHDKNQMHYSYHDLQTALESSYTHKPVQQNALYITSASEFGLKKPSAATFTIVKQARNQTFSNSYNKTMFRDHGLNTSLTRSNVHKHLDPQFV